MENATLEAGFEINAGNAFDTLAGLQKVMESTEYKVVQEAKKIEQATAGMIKLGGATAEVKTFGNVYSRELERLSRTTNTAERAGESMIQQIERQIRTFGKSTQEIREMNVEMRIMALEAKGLTDVAERLRAANAELQRLEGTSNNVRGSTNRTGFAMQNLGFQVQDFAVQTAAGTSAMRAFSQQMPQAIGAMQMMLGGTSRLATFLMGPWGIALITAASVAAALAGKLFETEKAADATGDANETLAEKLDLARHSYEEVIAASRAYNREQEQARETTLAAARAAVESAKANIQEAQSIRTKLAARLADNLAQSAILAATTPTSSNTGRDIVNSADIAAAKTRALIAENQAQIGALKSTAINAVNEVAVVQAKIASDPSFRIEQEFLAKRAKAAKLYAGDVDALTDAYTRLNAEEKKALDAVKDSDSARTGGRSRSDRRAEGLAREAQAIGAKVENLYKLADAYEVSGAAALIAEARVKAESEAIKKRGDVEAFVSREVQEAIAQRVSNAAQANAATREQITAQLAANDAVKAGLIPAAEAAQYVQDRIADLPLLAAIEAAQQRGLANEADRATKALQDQQSAREELAKATATAQFNTAIASGKDRLEELREELRLVGETDAARQMALATLRATQEAQAKGFIGTQAAEYIAQQQQIAQGIVDLKQRQDDYNASLTATADLFAIIDNAALNMADNLAAGFGKAGAAIGGALQTMTGYYAAQADLQARHQAALEAAGTDEMRKERENLAFKLQSSQLQTDAMMGITGAAKSLFKQHSSGYKVMMAAEKAMMVAQLARTAVDVAGGAAKMFSQLGIWAFPAVAAMGAVMASLGFFGGKSSSKTFDTKGNTGTGTVLGDSEAQSESIRRAIDGLREVDTLMLSSSRDMASSLRSIDSQIGSVAAILVRGGTITEGANVAEGFKPDFVGKLLGSIPLVGGLLGGLFGSKTSVLASGIYGGPQSLEDILGGGFDAQTYSDIKKKKKFFGVTTSTKYKTEYGGSAGDAVNDQFTLILKSFNDAILAAAGPLGASTNEIAAKLQGFVVDLGKIDLKDLTGEEIQEKLNAVFGAAADRMASYAFPGMERFQEVGEGLFETLVRVASTVESVTFSLDMLGTSIVGIDGKMDLADQFESLSQFSDAAQSYFESYYTKAEQNAAKEAQLAKVMNDLGFVMPDTLANFRSLVEAQDLTTAAGREAYAMLLKLAPAFADLKSAMDGARSAADILAERENLQKQILQLMGDTAALRAMELAKLDPSNRALQEQIYAIQDAQEAAQAAQELRDAWSSVGDSIMDEVARIRGLSGQQTGSNFATLMGQFNAATAAARAGDMAAAEDLPGISQAMLAAAALVARSRQELDRVQTDTAASLEATNAAIQAFASGGTSDSDILSAANTAQGASGANDNGNMVSELSSLKADLVSTLEAMRGETNNGLATIAGNTGRLARKMDDVTAQSGGDAISTVYVAA